MTLKNSFIIERLKRMALFARVVEFGSMSAAARELGMSPSAVSQQVRQLEAQTGIVLLHRSTRKLTLTEAGQAYYEDCAAMLMAAQSADHRLAELRDELRGELRIALPVGFSHHLASALAPLLRMNPQLSLRLFAGDEQIDLIEERIDVAIRVGTLTDSALTARRLAEWRHLLVASPSYAQRHGLPRTPEDLTQHAVLLLSTLNKPEYIELYRTGEGSRRVRVSGPVIGNSAEAIKQMMLQGLGISRIPGPDAAPLFAAGSVVPVLPDWSMLPLGVYALTVQRKSQPAKVKRAIDAIRDYLNRGGDMPA